DTDSVRVARARTVVVVVGSHEEVFIETGLLGAAHRVEQALDQDVDADTATQGRQGDAVAGIAPRVDFRGFDEIKWKCALFLFDADEVASTAPSQIQVLSSSGAILSSKTDKGAVQKLFKDKASVWTIDIGASRESTEE
ncbi:hypothetical protein SPRG_18132, partial [Saprolegnia parasitica CBS 223.65]